MVGVSNSARYVQPNRKDGCWDVVKPGHRRATTRATTRAEAVKAARKLVRSEGGGEVRVLNEYGKLVDTNTVSRPVLAFIR